MTWLNHYSALVAETTVGVDLANFDVVGTDGKLLQWLVGAERRTSADLVVPLVLEELRLPRVALIGGTPQSVAAAAHALQSRSRIVGAMDGFDGLLRGGQLNAWLEERAPQLVLVGLGAGLQELVAQEVASASAETVVLTCGGYLDQVSQAAYYPAWAYPLRLNWFVRLVREPRRLWRRYTIWAVRAVLRRGELRSMIRGCRGWENHQALTDA
ncbi:WecB/TagA/CpsF family glycosyltransferase [Blastococcus sp. LR1]|nr:WecB/TagA/CpsF family glycosyltransferase [Blastococcus sp. LR1]